MIVEWILLGLAIGFLVAGAVIVTWLLIGAAVTALRYFLAPPPPGPAGDNCAYCTQLQSMWDSMSWLEKSAAYLTFVGASIVCTATGCFSLDLRW
jgi:hypothetical protein